MLVQFTDQPLQRLQFSFKRLSGGDVFSAGSPYVRILLCSGRRPLAAAVTDLPHPAVHALASTVVPALRT